MARVATSRMPKAASAEGLVPKGYWEVSKTPLTCLLFLLPLMVLYEAGTYYFSSGDASEKNPLKAFDDIQRFFRLFGIGSQYWPPLALLAILLAWHCAHRYPWRLNFGTAACMPLESIFWCLPLFLLDALAKTYLPLRAPLHAGWLSGPMSEMIVLSVGAGVYEELVFRLGAMTLLSLMFENLLGMYRAWAILLMVVLSAMLFAWYHYQPGGETFSYQTFVFRTAAGIYFGLLFWRRGFGITCGAHASYDILAVLVPAFLPR